jgi:hypothetical protein
MKTMRFLVLVTAAGWALSACGDSGGETDGSGGVTASGGTTGSASGGTTGTASGGATGTGGHASGGATGNGSGGSASGGATGSSSGGATATGGHASGGANGSGTGGSDAGGSASGGTAGGAGGRAAGGRAGGGASGSGGSAMGGRNGTAGASGSGGTNGGAGTGGTLYNPCPTNGDPCRILPVGDSITFGINYEGSYRPELFHKALMAGQKITYTGTLQNGPTTVDNMPFPRRFEATSGITIDGISMQITKNNTLAMPADIVLIHIGTNDMYMSDPGGAPQRLGKLIDQIATGLPNALICVAKIIPLQMSPSNVTTFNNAIPGVVSQRVAQGKHVIVVDLNTGFPSGGMDSVHPYQSGYQWMGDKWYTAIGSLFPM